MLMRLSADIVIITHLSFILFVIFGGLLVMKWKKLVWLHIPAAVWGVLIEFYGWICPLTTLENILRQYNNNTIYSNSFIEQYIIPIIYPSGLTREIQIMMGVAVILINLFVYIFLYKKLLGHIDKVDR